MKKYRVFYAGSPDDAVLLSAKSSHEAAYLFFANEPRKASIFVETGSTWGEKSFSFDELNSRYPDMAQLLESFRGEKGVIAETLVKDHGLTRAPEPESPVADAIIRRFLLTVAGAVVVGVISIINSCTGN